MTAQGALHTDVEAGPAGGPGPVPGARWAQPEPMGTGSGPAPAPGGRFGAPAPGVGHQPGWSGMEAGRPLPPVPGFPPGAGAGAPRPPMTAAGPADVPGPSAVPPRPPVRQMPPAPQTAPPPQMMPPPQMPPAPQMPPPPQMPPVPLLPPSTVLPPAPLLPPAPPRAAGSPAEAGVPGRGSAGFGAAPGSPDVHATMALPPPPPVPPVPPYPQAGSGAGVATLAMPEEARSRLPGFDDNPYTLSRRGYVGPPPTRKRTRRPFLRVLVGLVVVGGLGFVGFRVTHPSPHRSPNALAVAFYGALQSGSASAVASDVEPQQQSAVSPALSDAAVRAFVHGQLAGGSVQAGTTIVDGAETSAIPQLCNSNLSCGPTVAVPTVRIAGAWYVDWNTWLQNIGQGGSVPG